MYQLVNNLNDEKSKFTIISAISDDFLKVELAKSLPDKFKIELLKTMPDYTKMLLAYTLTDQLKADNFKMQFIDKIKEFQIMNKCNCKIIIL